MVQKFTIEGETLFEVLLMTKHSATPMTVEVSKLDIDGVSFMLVRLFDTDGDVVEQFTDVISTKEKAYEWIDSLGIKSDDDLLMLFKSFQSQAKEFFESFLS